MSVQGIRQGREITARGIVSDLRRMARTGAKPTGRDSLILKMAADLLEGKPVAGLRYPMPLIICDEDERTTSGLLEE